MLRNVLSCVVESRFVQAEREESPSASESTDEGWDMGQSNTA